MIIRKKTESLFEIEFDESEIRSMEDIEDVFFVTPEEMIDRTLTESLRLGMQGIRNLLDVVTGKKGPKNGNENSPDNNR